MAIHTFLNFNGNCREAVEYYATVFAAEKPKIITFGDTPAEPDFPMTKEMKKLVAYTELQIFDTKIQFSDVLPGMPFLVGNNISLTISTNDRVGMRLIFDALKEGGKVEMELAETPWSKFYGALTDRYGIGWQFNYCLE